MYSDYECELIRQELIEKVAMTKIAGPRFDKAVDWVGKTLSGAKEGVMSRGRRAKAYMGEKGRAAKAYAGEKGRAAKEYLADKARRGSARSRDLLKGDTLAKMRREGAEGRHTEAAKVYAARAALGGGLMGAGAGAATLANRRRKRK